MSWRETKAGRVLDWLVGWSPQPSQERWTHCPICGSTLVGPYRAGGHAKGLPLEPPRAELIAKCPVRGHAPYNVDR